MATAYCVTCDSIQPVEDVEEQDNVVFCVTCGDQFEKPSLADTLYANYSVGVVMNVDLIPKKKDLKKVMVDVIGDGNVDQFVQVVTNAKYVDVGWVVIVALENAIVPAGASLADDTNAIQLKKTSIGGVKSEGMLCDSSMLQWTGGAKGAIQRLPDSYTAGMSPPLTRPSVEK